MEAECHNNAGGELEHDGRAGGRRRRGRRRGSKGGSFYEALACLCHQSRSRARLVSDEDLQTSAGNADASLSVDIFSRGAIMLLLSAQINRQSQSSPVFLSSPSKYSHSLRQVPSLSSPAIKGKDGRWAGLTLQGNSRCLKLTPKARSTSCQKRRCRL